jgi:hypothetical protein
LAKLNVGMQGVLPTVTSKVSKVTSPVRPGTLPWRLATNVSLPRVLLITLRTTKDKSGFGCGLLSETSVGLKLISNCTPYRPGSGTCWATTVTLNTSPVATAVGPFITRSMSPVGVIAEVETKVPSAMSRKIKAAPLSSGWTLKGKMFPQAVVGKTLPSLGLSTVSKKFFPVT